MSYFISDLKKIFKNKLVLGLFALMLIICIVDPFVNLFHSLRHSDPDFGDNPFMYWLLIDSSGFGFTIYGYLFLVFPVVATGLIYYQEKKSSVYNFLITRNSRVKYLLSKVITAFTTTFLIFLIPLTINIVITWVIFPGELPLGEQYFYYVPIEGSFAAYFYNVSPFLMAVIYTILNSFVAATLTVLTLGIHMIFRFKNIYLALLVPTIGVSLVSYVSQMRRELNECLNIIMQPLAAHSYASTFKDLFSALATLIIVTLLILVIGFRRNRESL